MWQEGGREGHREGNTRGEGGREGDGERERGRRTRYVLENPIWQLPNKIPHLLRMLVAFFVFFSAFFQLASFTLLYLRLGDGEWREKEGRRHRERRKECNDR